MPLRVRISPSTPRIVVAGAAAGFVGGLLGVGGGILLVPAIALWLGRPQHVAHATSLVAVAMSALVGAARFGADGAVSATGAGLLLAGSLVGARLGADLVRHVPERRLQRVFGTVMVLLAVRFLVTGGGDATTSAGVVPTLDAAAVVAHLVGGLAAGVVSSMLGVGGGVVMVPLLVLALGYGQHVAEGTSLAVIVPTALVGARRHARSGFTDWPLGLRLGASAVVASAVGASLALGTEPTTLARAFGVLLAIVGVAVVRRSTTSVSPPR